MRTLRLLVLLPPQDSEMTILTLRSYIFSEYGFASALALPAIIPLYPIPVNISVKELRKSLQSQSFPGFTITSSKLIYISGSLFLTIDRGKELPDIITRCRDLIIHPSSDQDNMNEKESFPCFPLYRGIYLAQNEQNIDEKEIIVNIPAFPVLNFKHFFISLLTIHIYSGMEKWWENVDWEIPIMVKSKG